MTGGVALVIALIAAVVGPLLAYITANRKLSGKIENTDADALWKESSAIRDDYRQRITRSDTRTASLEERVAKLEQLNNELLTENRTLRARVETLEVENADLHRQIDHLRREQRDGKDA